MVQKIVAFTGKAGSGKDTCGQLLITNHGFARLSFALPIYKMLEAAGFGWPTTQAQKEQVIPWLGKSWRDLATTLGTEWGRERVDPDLWVKLSGFIMQANPQVNYVITDCRFENEAAQVRELGGVVVHVLGRQHPVAAQTAAHASEQGIVVQTEDAVVHNDTDGLAVLGEKLHLALRHYL